MLKKSKFLIVGLVSLLGLAACNAGTTNNEPDPEDPPVDEDSHVVSESYWTANITQGGFFGVNHNFTMDLAMTDNFGRVESGQIANQNGNLHISFSTDESMDLYVELLTDSSYKIYSLEKGEWQVANLPSAYFTTLLGSYTMFINLWSFSDFTYNSETHAYERESDTINMMGTNASLSNISFKFEDSKLLSISYTATIEKVEYNCVVSISKWGQTSFAFPDVGGGTIEETTLTLSETVLTINAGDKKELRAIISPEDSSKEVTWSSSDDSIAEVEPTGKDTRVVNIKGHQNGTATITASIEGGLSATCIVTVIGGAQEEVFATSVVLSQNVLDMNLGDSVTLTATVFPSNAVMKKVHWTILGKADGSHKNVVSIVESGGDNPEATITATGPGTCTLRASVYAEVYAECEITVSDGGGTVVTPSLTLSKQKLEITAGNKAELIATISPDDASKTVSWFSTDSSIAEVEPTGTDTRKVNIKGHQNGTAIITASIEGGLSATCMVVVTGGTPQQIPATSIEITESNLNLEIGESVDIFATVYPENATNKLVHWSLDQKGVADLTFEGENNSKATVTATGKGTCTLTAIVTLGVQATCTITVTDAGGEEPPEEESALMNVTLKYKEFVGPLDYGEEELSNEQVDAIMGDVRLAIFEGEEVDEGIYENCAFEYYHESEPLAGAYLGTAVVDGDEISGGVDRYYNFQSEKFSFGRGISYRNIISVYGDLRVTLVTEENAEAYQMGEHTIEAGSYIMEGYLMDANGKVSGKGFAVFEKANNNPVHLNNIPEEYEEPDLSSILDNKLFVYSGYTSTNSDYGDDAYYDEAEQNATVSFFEDGTFEYHVFNQFDQEIIDNEIVYRGNFEVDYSSVEDPKYGEDIYLVSGYVNNIVFNEVEESIFEPFTFFYSAEDDAVYKLIEMYDDEWVVVHTICQEYALSSEEPEKYEIPVYDEWDEERVNDVLSSLDLSDSLPKVNDVKTFDITSIGIDNFSIECGFSNETKAASAYYNYLRDIRGILTLKVIDDIPYYFSTNNQFTVEISQLFNKIELVITVIQEEELEVSLNGIEAYNMTQEYSVGDEFSFDGVCYATYSNGQTLEVTPTSVSTPDMSEAGTQTITLTYVEDGVSKEFTYDITITESAQLVELTYQNDNNFDIFVDGAEFKIWAWGGEYGSGTWVDISSIDQETKTFVFSLYDNCDGFKIVRLNPNDMPIDEHTWGYTITAWNQTGNLSLPEDASVTILFAFNAGNSDGGAGSIG